MKEEEKKDGKPFKHVSVSPFLIYNYILPKKEKIEEDREHNAKKITNAREADTTHMQTYR